MAHTDPAATTITFWGASEIVSGSRFLVECHRRRILVDCVGQVPVAPSAACATTWGWHASVPAMDQSVII